MALTKIGLNLIKDTFKTEISGSITESSSSFSTRVTTAESELGNTIVSSSAQISTDISGSFSKVHFDSKLTNVVTGSKQISTDISGSFSKEHLAAKVANVVTSSAQISTDISGSFSKEHLAAKVANVVTSSAQLATDISGSFVAPSSSFSSRTTTLEGTGTIQGVGQSDAVTFATVNTGQGANELYDMNQNVKTDSDVTFANATIAGTLSAQEIHTRFVSASVTLATGSNQFGDALTDVQNFTGSVNMSSSLSVFGHPTEKTLISGSSISASSAQFSTAQIDKFTGAIDFNNENMTNVDIDSGTITGITDLAVADGGTGVSTLTDGGVLLGSGTSGITAMSVLGDGEMIVGDGSTDPVAESGATLRTSIGVGTTDSVNFGAMISGSSKLYAGTPSTFVSASDGKLQIQQASSGNSAISSDSILIVEGNTSANNLFQEFITPNDHQAGFLFTDGTADGYYTYVHGTTPYHKFGSGNADRVYINANGIEVVTGNVSGSATSTGSFGSLVVADKVQGDITVGGDIYGNDRLYLGTKMALDVNGTQLYVGSTTGANDNSAIYFRVDDANRMVVSSSGEVGIGLDKPTFHSGGGLHISNATAARLHLTDSDAGEGTLDGMYVAQIGTEAFVYNFENDALLFGTNTAERMRILAGGNVGIGTNVVPKKLTVAGEISGSDDLTISGDYINIKNTAQSGLRVYTNDTYANLVYDYAGNLKGRMMYEGTTSTHKWTIYANNSEKMMISGSGEVGIGTTAPNERLSVVSDQDGNYATSIKNTDADNGYGLLVQSGDNNDVRTLTARDKDGNPLFSVNSGGNVGIRTEAPGYAGNANHTTLSILNTDTTGDADRPAVLELAGNNKGDGVRVGEVNFWQDVDGGDDLVVSIIGAQEGTTTNNVGGKLRLQTKGDNDSLADRLVITEAGKVGIGSSTPVSQLDVAASNGSGPVGLTITNTNQPSGGETNQSASIDFRLTHPTNTYISAGEIIVGKEDDWNPGSGQADSFMAFNTTNAGVSHERIRIKSGGDVGIGTNNPVLRLEVSESVGSDFAAAVRNTSATGWGFQVQGGGDSGDYALHCKNHNDTQVLFTVRGDGCITAPALPAFNAHPAGVTSNITRNTNVAIILGTERFDQNADFQQSTGDGQGGDGSNLRGQFTAPITGKYQLNYNLLLNNIPTDTAYIEYGIITSNFSYYLDWNFGHDEAPEYGWDGHVSIVADMDASDTAYCFVHQAGGTDTTTDIGVKTNFSGFMVA